MKVLLSIRPEFANKIFEGTKLYEFRKKIFKNPNISKVLVYASSPVQKVIGEFEIDHILNDDPVILWQQTEKFSGISESYFFQYFAEKKEGFAIKIKNTRRYSQPLCLRKEFNKIPPQSFLYLV